jgi:hypothetical protein
VPYEGIVRSLHRRVHLDDACTEFLRVAAKVFVIGLHCGLQRKVGNQKGRLSGRPELSRRT